MAAGRQNDGIRPTDRGRLPIIPIQSSIINPPAFTLIELLVVISIVVLLMALLFPVLRRARNSARATACQARLHQWGLAFKMYTDGNEGRWFTAEREDDGRQGPQNWIGLVVPFFYNTLGFAACPMATSHGPDHSESGPFDAWWIEKFGPVASTPSGEMVYTAVSYGFNYFASWKRWKDPRSSDPRTFHWGHADVRGAANVPVLCDSADEDARMADGEPPPPRGVFPDNVRCTPCIDRHNGGINMLFMDWSVRKVGLKELWTLKWHRQCDPAGPWTRAGGVEPEDWPQWMRKFKDY